MARELNVDPVALHAAAARIESVRDSMAPGHLPESFAPAGGDAASAAAATRMSAVAAATLNQLWASWHELGEVAEKLRATAGNFTGQDAASAALLGSVEGGGAGVVASAPAPSAAPPAVVPQSYSAPPASSAEQLAQQVHTGAGAGPAESFGAAWSRYGVTLGEAAESAQSVAVQLGGHWSGVSGSHAVTQLTRISGSLAGSGGIACAVGTGGAEHAGGYRRVTDPVTGVPTPAQFVTWRNNLENASAANSTSGGLYSAAVAAAQAQLGAGYEQTQGAYGPYAVDATTGQLIDPLTGQPVDVPGLDDDLDDDADGSELMDSGQEILSGLLGGALAGVSAGMGAIQQGMQQVGQMAGQTAGQLAKAMSQNKPTEPPTVPGLPELGGIGGGGGEGPGGMVAAAATPPPAAAPPPPATCRAPDPDARSGRRRGGRERADPSSRPSPAP